MKTQATGSMTMPDGLRIVASPIRTPTPASCLFDQPCRPIWSNHNAANAAGNPMKTSALAVKPSIFGLALRIANTMALTFATRGFFHIRANIQTATVVRAIAIQAAKRKA